MRLGVCTGLAGAAWLCALASPVLAQEALTPPDLVWSPNVPFAFSPAAADDFADRLFDATALRGLGGDRFAPEISDTRSIGVSRQRDDGLIEQFRVRTTTTVSPLPPSALVDQGDIDVRYTRGWAMRSGETDGVQVEFTPHAGVGIGSDGGSAEAGATVRIGRLEVRDGNAYDEDQGRWYLFAAGSGTAVGLNWVRGADGWGRQLTHDSGSFIGDAQIGVAWRRGDSQASFGYVHREVTADGVHGGTGIDRDATEGFVAFQYSLRPDW